MDIDVFLGKARFNKFKRFMNERFALALLSKEILLSDAEIFELYFRHWHLVSHLYQPLHLLEIVVRNTFHRSISLLLEDSNWLGAVAYGYKKEEGSYKLTKEMPKIIFRLEHMLSDTGKTKEEKIKRFIDWVFKSKENATNKGKAVITEDDLIANTEFSFWTTLASPNYKELVARNIFFWEIVFDQNIPANEQNIRRLSHNLKKLNDIRNVRNKLYHYDFVSVELYNKTIENMITLFGLILRKNFVGFSECFTFFNKKSQEARNDFLEFLHFLKKKKAP